MSRIKATSTNSLNRRILSDECPEIYAINTIGGQWSLVICSCLLEGKLRFGELRKLIPAITERMLTLHLRKLEANGILSRKVYPEVPPKVEYELTPIGYELKPVIRQLEKWGISHRSACNTGPSAG